MDISLLICIIYHLYIDLEFAYLLISIPKTVSLPEPIRNILTAGRQM